jgi:hypothetical protein
LFTIQYKGQASRLTLKAKVFIIFYCESVIYDMASFIGQAIPKLIRIPILKIDKIIKFSV